MSTDVDKKELVKLEDGTVRSKTGKFVKGYCPNPKGRPKGSRNKSSLVKAQLEVDDASEVAAKMLTAMLTGNADALEEFGLKPEDVNAKLKFEAAKQVLSMAKDEMKALKEGESDKGNTEQKKEEEKPKGPIFSSVSKIPQKSA